MNGRNSHFNNGYVNNFNKPDIACSVNDSLNTCIDVSNKKIDDSCDLNTDICSENVDFFEIFGLKLYFDDILLICIIFFLYNEGVKDQWLFVTLILLLLS